MMKLDQRSPEIEATPPTRQLYTLAELLGQSDDDPPPTVEERQWINGPTVGRELI